MTVPHADPELAAAIRRVQGGDVEAFAELVHRLQRPLRSWISRDCIPGIEADDIAHRAFITAFDRIHTFAAADAADGRCFAWLCSIARNHLRDELKRVRRRRQVHPGAMDRLVELEQAGVKDDEGDLDDRRLRALRICLNRLPTAMAELVEGRYTQQMPLRDLALQLGTSLAAVKVRLFDLRRRLLACVTARLAEFPE